jgi:Uma2 family endonuclease
MARDYLPRNFSAEQIMAMPALEAHRWTAAEVRKLTADNPLLTPRYELVDGELLVTPSPGRPHQRTVKDLMYALETYLRSTRAGEVCVSPSDVELEEEFITQPDLFVVSPAESRRLTREGYPVYELMLAIEVISPSSGRHDRVRKRPKYQKHVQEYWIVDPDARLIERWRGGDERPEIITAQFAWQPPADVAPFTLDVEAFFADVYREEPE